MTGAPCNLAPHCSGLKLFELTGKPFTIMIGKINKLGKCKYAIGLLCEIWQCLYVHHFAKQVPFW